MDRPARSLDLSPVEHRWDALGDKREPTILQQLTFTTVEHVAVAGVASDSR